MSHRSFPTVWLYRSALLFGFLIFIPFNGLNISDCTRLFPTFPLIQDPLALLRNIFPILLTGLAAWQTRSAAADAKLKFVLHYLAVPLFVAYGILVLYISSMLCYSNVIGIQLVSIYVDGWLNEIANSFLLGLFLGVIYGLSIPLLKRALVFGYSHLEWVISGEKPHVHTIPSRFGHNNQLFLARAGLLSLLLLLVLSFTTPIHQAVTSNPEIIFYSFNFPMQVSLLTIPFLVALGEALTVTFDQTRRLSDSYFRWLLAALSLGAAANFALFQLSKLGFNINGVAYMAKPVASIFLMFVGASIAIAFSLEIGERCFRNVISELASVVGMLLSVMFLVETNAGLLLNSSLFGKPPNPILVSWHRMIFFSEPLPMVSAYVSASTLIYAFSFIALVLFYYRASLPTSKLSRMVPAVLSAGVIFVYQWASPSGYAAIWRSLLCALIMGLLVYRYVPVYTSRNLEFLARAKGLDSNDGKGHREDHSSMRTTTLTHETP